MAKTHEQFVEELKSISPSIEIVGRYTKAREVKAINPTVEVIGTYKGRHAPVKARCLICGYEWTPQASSLLRGSTHKGATRIHSKI